jgi:hypothetical protein
MACDFTMQIGAKLNNRDTNLGSSFDLEQGFPHVSSTQRIGNRESPL